MMIEVIEPRAVPRCRAMTIATLSGGGYSLQCEEIDEHLGYHCSALGPDKVWIWPSEDDVRDAKAQAELASKTDEEVMAELSGGDPAEEARIKEWAHNTVAFTRWGIALRQEADALKAERNDLADRLAFARDSYSHVGARGCPICVYENGVFIRLCKIHEECKAEYDWLAADHAVVQQRVMDLERDNEQLCRGTATLRTRISDQDALLAERDKIIDRHEAVAREHDEVRDELYKSVAELEGKLEDHKQETHIDRIVLGHNKVTLDAMQPVIAAALAMRNAHEGCVTEPACGSCTKCVFDQACDAWTKFMEAELSGAPT